MRALLSTVGTRGDVQPVLGLAVAIRALGHEVRLCIPPNFIGWAKDLGFDAVPVGVEMRAPPKPAPGIPPSPPPPMPDLIGDQFEKVGAAAQGCDVIVGGNAHQYAARSIAERLGIPFVDALYAAVSIPSKGLAPPPAPGTAWEPGVPDDNARRWAENKETWNARALERLNANRTRLGLAPVDDVLSHILGGRPWLAADATLGPLPALSDVEVVQTGAWILEDRTELSRELQTFLDAGSPPIYVGFGSMPLREGLGDVILGAIRAAGYRAIVSQGWGGLALSSDARDVISIGDVNQQALFQRVAAVMHHGGAGTTTTAAMAGVSQIITPMFSDQFYWGHRVQELGIGASLPHARITAESLGVALESALSRGSADRARTLRTTIRDDGAQDAARRVVALAG